MEDMTNEQLYKTYLDEQNKEQKEKLRDLFFEKNKSLPYYMARKIQHPRLDIDDAMGYASIGMIKAFNTYDLSKNVKFVSYAGRIMTNEILMQLRKSYIKQDICYLEDTIKGQDGDNMTYMTMLKSEDLFEEDNIDTSTIPDILDSCKDFLTEKEYIVLMNFLSDKPKIQSDLKTDLGVSQSYVSRLMKQVVRKIKNFLESKEADIGETRQQSVERERVKGMTTVSKKEIESNLEVIAEEQDKQKEKEQLEIDIVEEKQENKLKTTKDMVRHLMHTRPEMTRRDIANELEKPITTINTYYTQINRETKNKQEQGTGKETVSKKMGAKQTDGIESRLDEAVKDIQQYRQNKTQQNKTQQVENQQVEDPQVENQQIEKQQVEVHTEIKRVDEADNSTLATNMQIPSTISMSMGNSQGDVVQFFLNNLSDMIDPTGTYKLKIKLEKED